MKGLASKAPFGRGPETLYDDNVRKCWQFEPHSVQVDGPEWNETLNKILLDASYDLGLSNESVMKMGIKANLYKVLLYEEGGHFTPHTDTEKDEGMFASLVIQLPSSFKGGDVRVSHQGKTMTLEIIGRVQPVAEVFSLLLGLHARTASGDGGLAHVFGIQCCVLVS